MENSKTGFKKLIPFPFLFQIQQHLARHTSNQANSSDRYSDAYIDKKFGVLGKVFIIVCSCCLLLLPIATQ